MSHDQDISLVSRVHEERRNGLVLRAYLTRFGGLSVIIYTEEFDALWQGDNILKGREWIDRQPARQAA